MAGMMPRPIPPGVVEIDDSRLRDMWTRHQQRSLFTARAVRWIGVAAVLGIAAVLAAIALAFWALERNPPVVNVAPAEVHVTVPEQKAPVVNVTVPEQKTPVVNVYPNITIPPQAAQPVPPAWPQVPQPAVPGPENKVVTEFTVFHTVPVDGVQVTTGWDYHNSNDAAPWRQYCYFYPRPTRKVQVATDRVIDADLDDQVADAGVSRETALRYADHCIWFGG